MGAVPASIANAASSPATPGMGPGGEHRGGDDRADPGDRKQVWTPRAHLRRVLAQNAEHYNTRRPHRAQHLRPPRQEPSVAVFGYRRIRRRPVRGPQINEYERAA